MNQDLAFNFFNILIISATVHGFVFSMVIFFSKRHNSKSKKYLAQLILFLSLSNLYYWFVDTRITYGWDVYRYLCVPWSLLIMPTFYFFVDSYLNQVRASQSIKKFLLLPFYISLSAYAFVAMYRLFFATYSEGRMLSIYIMRVGEYITPTLFVVVTVLIFRMIHKYERTSSNLDKDTVKVETKWLKLLLYAGMAVCVVLVLFIIVKIFTAYSTYEYEYLYYFVWIGMSAIIYSLGYAGIHHVDIFNQRSKIRENFQSKEKDNLEKKYNIERYEELHSTIMNERLFANANCSLVSLAERFDISEGYLSQLINKFSGSNSNTYINNLRLQQVTHMLTSPEYEKYTIVSLGLEAGFNSKSTFYDAFKKNYGMTPSQFKKRAKTEGRKTADSD